MTTPKVDLNPEASLFGASTSGFKWTLGSTNGTLSLHVQRFRPLNLCPGHPEKACAKGARRLSSGWVKHRQHFGW